MGEVIESITKQAADSSSVDPTYTETNITPSSKISVFDNAGQKRFIGVARIGKLVLFYIRFGVKSGQTLSNPETILTNLPPFEGGTGNAACLTVDSCARDINHAASDFTTIKTTALLVNGVGGTSASVSLYSSVSLTSDHDIYISGQYITK